MDHETGNKFMPWLLVGGLIVVATAVVLLPRHEDSARRATAAGTIRGTPAPSFEFRDLDGKRIRLQDFKGRVVLVNFWGTTCAPCITEIPWLVDFQKRYGPKGLAVIAISMYGDSPDVLRSYITEHGMKNFTVVVGSQQTAELFGGVYGLPHTFVVDPHGRYVSSHAGMINRSEVETELDALLNHAS
jgi:peroxiredoxin